VLFEVKVSIPPPPFHRFSEDFFRFVSPELGRSTIPSAPTWSPQKVVLDSLGLVSFQSSRNAFSLAGFVLFLLVFSLPMAA